MAIDAIVIGKSILIYRHLLKRPQIALINAHFIPESIGGLNEAISDIRIYLFLSYMHVERQIGRPPILGLVTNGQSNVLSSIMIQEVFPFLCWNGEQSLGIT